MIYIAKKHSRSHVFPGDIDKEILQYYRDRKWKITLDATRSIPNLEKTEPRPAPRVISFPEKTHERRERHVARVLGRRVVVD